MKLIIHSILLLSTFSFLSCNKTEEDVSPKDFVSYYSFDGNANDIKNNQNSITNYRAKLVNDKNGKLNSAYYFDGNAYIELPVPSIQNTFSLSFWAMASAAPSPGTIGAAISIGSSGGDQLINTANDYYGVSGWALTSYNSDGTNLGLNTGTLSSLSVNNWVHLVISRDSKNFKAYVDGKLLGTLPTNSKNAGYGNSQTKFYVGNRHSGQSFVGSIDEIKIFDRVLTDDEVKKLFSSY